MDTGASQHSTSMLQQLWQQQQAQRFCDVTLHVQDQEFICHKNVLAACSLYFDSILKESTVSKESLTVACDAPHLFEKLLRFMYTGEVELSITSVSEFLKLAGQFMIATLKTYCCRFLERNLDCSNCFYTQDIAVKFECGELTEVVKNFININAGVVIEQNEILQFPFTNFEQFISSKNLKLNEDQKFRLLLVWVKHQASERETYFSGLLGILDWSQVSPVIVLEALKGDPLLTSSPWCVQAVLRTIKEYTSISDMAGPGSGPSNEGTLTASDISSLSNLPNEGLNMNNQLNCPPASSASNLHTNNAVQAGNVPGSHASGLPTWRNPAAYNSGKGKASEDANDSPNKQVNRRKRKSILPVRARKLDTENKTKSKKKKVPTAPLR